MERKVGKMRRILLGSIFAIISAFVVAASASAVVYDFESFSASTTGVALDGQGGFYIPTSDTGHYYVYTYDGNQPFYDRNPSSTYSVPTNPYGNSNFVAGPGIGNYFFLPDSYNRAQKDTSFLDNTTWTIGYDFLAGFAPPDDVNYPYPTDYVGSFSLLNQSAGVNSFINLMSWTYNPSNPDNPPIGFNSTYLAYDADGNFFYAPGVGPGSEWNDLSLDHWYRAWTTFDLSTNMITEVGLMDLSTLVGTSYNPTDWYLEGVQAGGIAPDAFRLFTGGSGDGNLLAFDNISVAPVPEPATMLLLGSGLAGLAALRRRFKR